MLTVKFSQCPTFLWTNNSRSPDVHTLQIHVNSLEFWVFPPSSLQAMFSTDLIESKQERVAINGVEPQMIGMLVSYAYTSEVYISKANVGRDGRSRGLLSLYGASDGRDELCWDSLLR